MPLGRAGSRAGLLSIYFFLPSSHAQRVVDIPPSTPGPAPTVSISTTNTQTSFSRTRPRQSMATSFTVTSASNTTTSATTSLATAAVPPDLFSGANPPDVQRERTESVFNYYFLFLAVFGVLIAVGLWWIHRRRKRRKEQMRLSGQDALARDLDGWVNTRRWMHGAWRHNQTAAFVRREDGLNEHGEAPPPYQPKSEVTVGHQGAGAALDSTSGVTIPLRTLSREVMEGSQPPEYQERGNRHGSSNVRPDTATTRTTRPGTADLYPNTSTRDLLRSQGTPPHG